MLPEQSTENGDAVVRKSPWSRICFCLVGGGAEGQDSKVCQSCPFHVWSLVSSQSGSSLGFQGKVSHPLPVVNKQGRGPVVVSLVGDQNWHSSTALAPATLLLSLSGQ